MDNKKILVVDDTPDAADVVALLLRMHGYQVVVAYSGEQAITMCRAAAPDVAVIDIRMPEMDGYEVATRLRRLDEYSPRYLIALSAEARHLAEPMALEHGFDLFLSKPLELPALLDALPLP